jgi:hypothetical protein
MERAGDEVRRKALACVLRGSLVLLFLSLAPRLPAQSKSDFLVVEKAERLLAYNKYQQRATEQERKSLVGAVPMRILKADALLGDGFIHCMQVEIQGEMFFLQKDNDGKLSRSGSLGLEKIFRNAAILLDTVEVLTNRSVYLSPPGSPSRPLFAGETLVRIFRHADAVYCMTTGISPAYGWVDFRTARERGDWRVRTPVSSKSLPVSDAIIQQVRSRIDRVNHLLAQLFDHFNNETHQQKQSPRWVVETSGNAISCTLEGASQAEDFRQSSAYLAMDIESLVLGTNLDVTNAPGSIKMRQK